MRILNLEDDIFKHRNIRAAIEEAGISNLELKHIDNLEDGINNIRESIDNKTPYDLIISDMWYPKRSGGEDEKSGELLIGILKENSWNIPIIICSSLNYNFNDVFGCVYYSENSDWERKLVDMITKCLSVQ